MIVKLVRYAVRRKTFKNKRTLKGKRLLITENLTSSRMYVLGEAQKKYGVRNAWTSDGRVMFKENNNKVFLYKAK